MEHLRNAMANALADLLAEPRSGIEDRLLDSMEAVWLVVQVATVDGRSPVDLEELDPSEWATITRLAEAVITRTGDPQ